jgi:L-fuconate dehydratase
VILRKVTMSKLTGIEVLDLRFPTSKDLDGSDAMNQDPDYSAAYVTLTADSGEEGYGFVFTIGRGNDVQAAAINALRDHLLALNLDDALNDMGGFWKSLVHDSQLRWLGPEKGVMHMAIGAVVNAMWDLKARRANKPLWKLLADMTPGEIVGLLDFRYLSNALTEGEALEILEAAQEGKAEREATLLAQGYPAYTTSPGWLGYSDEKMLKLKVGGNLADDIRRIRLAREALGPDFRIAIDANQRWEASEAIDWVNELAPYNPWWVEEPTNPDDILAHAEIARGIAPIKVATGEHGQNRILFKQLMQAEALEIVQIDSVRVAGVNENIAILLLAAKFGLPVCPHAGGVGLCELVQHISMFDYLAVSGTTQDRVIEYVDHLHEHFETPVVIKNGNYVTPTAPGSGARMHAHTIQDFIFPSGRVWQQELAEQQLTQEETSQRERAQVNLVQQEATS